MKSCEWGSHSGNPKSRIQSESGRFWMDADNGIEKLTLDVTHKFRSASIGRVDSRSHGLSGIAITQGKGKEYIRTHKTAVYEGEAKCSSSELFDLVR